MIEVDFAVLGCGWAGIIATYELVKRGITTLCLEEERKPGGLLRSEYHRGFMIDVGGSHVIFSKDNQVLNTLIQLLEGNMNRSSRSSFVNLKGNLIPYPIETGLHVLSLEERFEAVKTFIEALLSQNKSSEPRNLLEWLYYAFGSWIAKNYLEPYNKKLWKRPLNQIDLDWIYIPGRLPLPNWEEVIKAAIGLPTVGYKEQAIFYYPARGGIEALFNAVYSKALNLGAKILTNVSLKKLNIVADGIIINDNIRAKYVINTIPLPKLISILEGNHDLTTYLKYFDYNKVVVIAVAINKPAPPHHWVYIPDERIAFHRYAWTSNYSPNNAPSGQSLALLEITIPKNEDISKELATYALKDFLKIVNLGEDNIIFMKTYINEYGYPIHTLNTSNIRDTVLKWLEEEKIISVGRWGSWRYLNIDAVYKNVQDTINSRLQKG